DAFAFASTGACGVAAFARRAFTFWPFRRAKTPASKRKITASPLKLPGVTVKRAESLCAISVPFNNETREKAITISAGHTKHARLNRRFVCPEDDRERSQVASFARRGTAKDPFSPVASEGPLTAFSYL